LKPGDRERPSRKVREMDVSEKRGTQARKKVTTRDKENMKRKKLRAWNPRGNPANQREMQGKTAWTQLKKRVQTPEEKGGKERVGTPRSKRHSLEKQRVEIKN